MAEMALAALKSAVGGQLNGTNHPASLSTTPRAGSLWLTLRCGLGERGILDAALRRIEEALQPWAAAHAGGLPVAEVACRGSLHQAVPDRLALFYRDDLFDTSKTSAPRWMARVRQALNAAAGVTAVWLFHSTASTDHEQIRGQRTKLRLELEMPRTASGQSRRDDVLRDGLGSMPALREALEQLGLLGDDQGRGRPTLICAPASHAQQRRLAAYFKHRGNRAAPNVRDRASAPRARAEGREFAWTRPFGDSIAPPPAELLLLAGVSVGLENTTRLHGAVAIAPGRAVALLDPQRLSGSDRGGMRKANAGGVIATSKAWSQSASVGTQTDKPGANDDRDAFPPGALPRGELALMQRPLVPPSARERTGGPAMKRPEAAAASSRLQLTQARLSFARQATVIAGATIAQAAGPAATALDGQAASTPTMEIDLLPGEQRGNDESRGPAPEQAVSGALWSHVRQQATLLEKVSVAQLSLGKTFADIDARLRGLQTTVVDKVTDVKADLARRLADTEAQLRIVVEVVSEIRATQRGSIDGAREPASATDSTTAVPNRTISLRSVADVANGAAGTDSEIDLVCEKLLQVLVGNLRATIRNANPMSLVSSLRKPLETKVAAWQAQQRAEWRAAALTPSGSAEVKTAPRPRLAPLQARSKTAKGPGADLPPPEPPPSGSTARSGGVP